MPTVTFVNSALVVLDGLYIAARASGADDAGAQSAVADVLGRIRERFPSEGPDGAFKIWLFMALREEAASRGWAFPALPATAPADEGEAAPVDLGSISAERLREAVAGLAPLHRMLLLLSDREGLGYRETAAILSGTPDVAASALRSARRALRRALA